MFFEADYDLPNASGGRADVRFPHRGQAWFAYVDGHVARVSGLPAQSHWLPYPPPKPVKKAPVKKAPATKVPVQGKHRR
jgi:prepilin-type processing-associated H-X9-DG protein